MAQNIESVNTQKVNHRQRYTKLNIFVEVLLA